MSQTSTPSSSDSNPLLASEDWWAVWIGMILLLLCSAVVAFSSSEGEFTNPLKPWLAKPGSWTQNPIEAVATAEGGIPASGLIGAFLVSLIVFGVGASAMGYRFKEFVGGFCLLFGLATLAYFLAGQEVVKRYNLEYALWPNFSSRSS